MRGMFDPQSKEIFGSNSDRFAAGLRAEAVGSTTEGVSPLDSTGRPISWNNRADQMYSCESSPVDMMEGVEVNSGAPVSEDDLVKRAEAYQQYMKKIEVPRNRGSLIPFTTWMGLGKSIKQLYGQPLHYLTNITLQQLDQKRFGSEDEYMPLDLVLHPCKAEAMIWLMEEVHRSTSSHLYIAERWKSDPFYHAFLDSGLVESSN